MMRVLRPGLLTSVQDLGRYGMQHLGIVPCGAMDPVSHRLANALVGNAPDLATLECTVIGPELEFESAALIALAGAEFDARVQGERLPRNRPVLLPAGARIAVGAATRGVRAYLAVAGGIDVAPVLGSRSTYIPAGFGGAQGRALRAGDPIALSGEASELAAPRYAQISRNAASQAGGVHSVRWHVAPPTVLRHGPQLEVRAMAGRHLEQFDAASRDALFTAIWRVSPDSNRMGYRLSGPRLSRRKPVELLSEPTCLGTVQAPNDGAPIVLMADHQTTGGYPKVAEVAHADVCSLAQLGPGGTLRFRRCEVGEAREAWRDLEQRLVQLEAEIGWRYRR